MNVNWQQAGQWAGRLAPAGPMPSREVAAAAVRELNAAAERAYHLALEASGLASLVPAVRAAVLVVDRAGWARAAAASFGALSGDVRAVPGGTGQAGAVLAALATRVLGQFDPFGTAAPGGRLLLVAPNVLRTEQVMAAPPADFRLWVATHEQTHALQFAAAPWLADHLRAEAAALFADLGASAATDEMGAAVGAVLRGLLRGEGVSVLDLLPATARARTERLTAVMSLLEGHADVTMDVVGERELASARTLRNRMEARRRRAKGMDLLLRKLLGLDAKLAQYRNGAAFVRRVGLARLEPVWSGPQALPTPAEIADPAAWLRRM